MRSLAGVILALAACGRVGFDPLDPVDPGAAVGETCAVGADCASSTCRGGVCVDGVRFQSASRTLDCSDACDSMSQTVDHALLPGVDRLIVVVLGNGELEGVLPSSVTFGGAPATRLGGIAARMWPSVEMFFVTEAALVALGDGVHLVVATASEIDPLMVVVLQFEGVRQASPLGAVTTGETEGDQHTLYVASSDGDLIVDALASGREGGRSFAVPSAEPRQVVRGEVQVTSNRGGSLAVSTRPWVADPTPMTYQLGSVNFPFAAHVAAAIHPAP